MTCIPRSYAASCLLIFIRRGERGQGRGDRGEGRGESGEGRVELSPLVFIRVLS